MSEQVVVRKVQRLGGSSLIITLPKQWAKRLGIKVGDEISVIDEGDKLTIAPVDPRAEKRANSLQVKYNSTVRSAGLGNVVNCAFMNGYSRLDVILEGVGQAEVRKVLEELRSSPKVASVEVGTDRVIASLAPSAEDAPRLLRELNSVLQEMLDATRSRSLESIGVLERRASQLAEATARALRSGQAEQMAVGLLLSLPVMLSDTLRLLAGRQELVDKLKEMVGELVGGLANMSVKRLSHALALAAELRKYAMHAGDAVAVLAPLAGAVEATARALMCQALTAQEPPIEEPLSE